MAQIDDLSGVAERLERRRSDRWPAGGAMRLRLPSRPQPVEAQMTDLSSDGIGGTVPTGTPVAVGDRVEVSLDLGGGPAAVTARVVRRTVGPDAIELGLQLVDVPPAVQARLAAQTHEGGAGSR
jgi:methyl-accepting chemotaxis protein